ncbi:hypothetical protein HJC23_013990 [Cyclotella cryptica]|uniref:Uncharacterized protein n=1 Tax=Cyclotella cryptica TaxID=29204 RepID=A0ABD3NX41_9STRA
MAGRLIMFTLAALKTDIAWQQKPYRRLRHVLASSRGVKRAVVYVFGEDVGMRLLCAMLLYNSSEPLGR